MKKEIVIFGEPMGKQRARTVKNGGKTHSYTPSKTADYEKKVRAAWHEEHSGFKFESDTPLAVSIDAYFRIPASYSKIRRERCSDGLETPTKKPDCDNIAKIICDALNGTAYGDDKQVIWLFVKKLYGAVPRVEVRVWETKV